MKRLFTILAACVALSFCLVSCNQEKEVVLHPLVGTLHEDGIVFDVAEDGSYALICSFHSLKMNRFKENNNKRRWVQRNSTWCEFATDTLKEYDTIGWNVVSGDSIPVKDSTYYYAYIGTSETDGEANTDKIISHPIPKHRGYSGASAAKYCREYYHKKYLTNSAEDRADTAYKKNQGKWYLPSSAELKKLANARKKVNEVLAATDTAYELVHQCYWSSTEFNTRENISSNAYYQCFKTCDKKVCDDKSTDAVSYLPKNSSQHIIAIRAVRKVPMQDGKLVAGK